MTGVTTGQTSLPTATDSDDNEGFLTGPLTTALQTLANLFESATGHDHTGAGKGKPIGSAGIAAGAIGTTQLAANAVTQRFVAVGSTSGPTTASTALVDLQEMVVNLTTAGGDIEAEFVCVVNNSLAAPNGIALALKLDAAAAVANVSTTSFAAGASILMSTFYLWTGVAAGAHTVKGQFAASAGGTVTAVTTQRLLRVKEIKV